MTFAAPTTAFDVRLAGHLEILRIALAAYLGELRSSWSDPPSSQPAASSYREVDRLLAAVGTQPAVGEESLGMVEAILAVAREDSHGPLARLASGLALTVGEELLVAAAWWSEADPQLATVFGCAHDDGARRFASAALLRLVLAPLGIDVAPAVDDDSVLVRSGVLETGAGATGPLRLTATARRVLAGRPIAPSASVGFPPARLAGLEEALARHLESGEGGVVVLRGPSGVGRRALAEAAAIRAGLVAVPFDRPVAELRLLARLHVAVPVATVAQAEGGALATGIAPAGGTAWSLFDGPLILVAPPGERPPGGGYLVDVPPPNYAERSAHWSAALSGAGFGGEEAASLALVLAARFRFTEGDVDAVLRRARLDASWTGQPVDEALVWAAAKRQPEHALERLASLVTPVFDLDDLVVTDDARAQLRELIAHVALQHVVLDTWGFRQRMPRGQGVLALFVGPPGTGKTMAAEALASALRHDLYRIDLSAVVSKYIGETEKNLGSAFDEAERAGAVLFFDEADALFGKRTDVRDAHDRYANMEVNYLLQRVEAFTGLVILASNRRAALDEAFVRRLRFVIRFDMPDSALRRALWQRAFPPGASMADLDWDALAAAELAGGSIQQVALHAAFLAAANGGVITPDAVQGALKREYDKLGRAWPAHVPNPAGGG